MKRNFNLITVFKASAPLLITALVSVAGMPSTYAAEHRITASNEFAEDETLLEDNESYRILTTEAATVIKKTKNKNAAVEKVPTANEEKKASEILTYESL